MTEPESEELYDELRRKLADYGSEPSEAVWAGIRQQLPPFAAPPMARTPWWRGPWAMVAVVTGLIGALWLLQANISQPSQRPSAAQVAQPGTAVERGSVATQDPFSVNNQDIASHLARKSSTTAASTAAPINQPTTGSLVRAATQASEAAGSLTQETGAAANPVRAETSTAGGAALAYHQQQTKGQRLVAAPFSDAKLLPGKRSRPSLDGGKRASRMVFADKAHRPATSQTNKGRHHAVVATDGFSAASTHPKSPTVALRAGLNPKNPHNRLTASKAALLVTPAWQRSTRLSAPTGSGVAFVQLLPVPLQTPGWAKPKPKRVAVESVPPAGPRRWAVQMLAGPTVSYRSLSSDSLPRSLALLERPAPSYAAQIQLVYTLSRRWQLTGGLGYTVYASSLNLRLRKSLGTTDSTATEQHIRQRDVYRYLQIPLQLQYELGSRNRLSYGLLGGTTLGYYVGGRTSDGTPCACEQRTWSSTNHPYRKFNASLTAGIDLRYHLSPQWQLTTQPTFRYSLSTVSPTANRRAFAAGLLTGFTYHLR